MISWTDKEIEEARRERLEGYEGITYPIGPGSYSYHEAVDRSIMLCDLLEYILNHPSVIHDRTAFTLAHNAHTNLFNLYQYIGIKHTEAPSLEQQ